MESEVKNPTTALVLETNNLASGDGDPDAVERSLARLLVRLRAQTRPLASLDEVVVVHAGLAPTVQGRLQETAGRRLTFVPLDANGDYYAAKDAGSRRHEATSSRSPTPTAGPTRTGYRRCWNRSRTVATSPPSQGAPAIAPICSAPRRPRSTSCTSGARSAPDARGTSTPTTSPSGVPRWTAPASARTVSTAAAARCSASRCKRAGFPFASPSARTRSIAFPTRRRISFASGCCAARTPSSWRRIWYAPTCPEARAGSPTWVLFGARRARGAMRVQFTRAAAAAAPRRARTALVRGRGARLCHSRC